MKSLRKRAIRKAVLKLASHRMKNYHKFKENRIIGIDVAVNEDFTAFYKN